jgi:predicted CopG family antitoxin
VEWLSNVKGDLGKCVCIGNDAYICAYICTVPMTKVISLSEKAYGTLKKRKRPNESFSDVVMRLASQERKKSILEFAGTWKGSDIDGVFSKLIKDREHSASRSIEI